jgi:hypothetical protein
MTENGVAPVAPDEDLTPTQETDLPPTKAPDAWVMPEPVFRRSEGYTPGRVGASEDETATPDLIPIEESFVPDAEAPSEIAEQPELADVVTSEPSGETVETKPKQKRGFLRLLLLILGIAGIAIVVGAIIAAVVLWYFFQVSESQNLN